MKGLFELANMVGDVETSLSKAQAIENEIFNHYFTLSEKKITLEVLKYYHSHYRILYDVLIDYLIEARCKVAEIDKAVGQMRKTGENKPTILFNKCSTDVQQNE